MFYFLREDLSFVRQVSMRNLAINKPCTCDTFETILEDLLGFDSDGNLAASERVYDRVIDLIILNQNYLLKENYF